MKRPIVWLVVALAALGAAYVLSLSKSYCERAADDYCRRPGITTLETIEECVAKATQDCEARRQGG